MSVIDTLNFIRLNASNDYQDRVPEATRDNISDVGNAIMDYVPTQNEFLESLVNKIGLTLISSNTFDNPFAEFKGEQIDFGDTIEDIFIELPKGVEFPDIVEGESLDPFKVTKAQLKVLYHKIDREVQYPITIQDNMLKRAFRNTEGMTRLINEIVDTLYQALSYDEFVYAKQLLSIEDNYGKVIDLGNFEETKDLAEAVNAQLRIVASNMKYKRSDYNALGVETWTPKDNIAIVLRNDIKEAIDLTVLAGVFNMNKVELSQRIIEVDSFETDEQVACIIDTRGLRIHDALKNAETQRNARGQYTNYFVNHWGLLSFSRYRNAVMIKGFKISEQEVTLGDEGEEVALQQELSMSRIGNADIYLDDTLIIEKGEPTSADYQYNVSPDVLYAVQETQEGALFTIYPNKVKTETIGADIQAGAVVKIIA